MLQILALITVSLFLILWLLATRKKHTENFANASGTQQCPPGTNPFFDKSGDTVCCDGQVQGNQCTGTIVCTFATNHASLPTCSSITQAHAAEMSAKLCPPSMPLYETDSCKSSAAPSAKTCKIYQNQLDNKIDPTSCYNQRLLENTACFGTNCTKRVVPQKDAGMCLIQVEFTGQDGHRRNCYTKETYGDYLQTLGKKSSFDPDRNILICDVAKAVFVDRTMDVKDALL